MSTVSSDWITKEITAAEKRLLEVEHELHFATHEQSISHNGSNVSATPISKLRSMEENIDRIALAHEYHCVTSKYNFSAATSSARGPNDSSSHTDLTPMIQFCRKLGTVLLHHEPPKQQQQFSTAMSYPYQAMVWKCRLYSCKVGFLLLRVKMPTVTNCQLSTSPLSG